MIVWSIFQPSDSSDAPQLVLEIPSDTESVQSHTGHPGHTGNTGNTGHQSRGSKKQRSPPRFHYHQRHGRGRRASHAVDFLTATTAGGTLLSRDQTREDTFLFPHKTRLMSLGDLDTSEVVRTFAIEGHRVVNKGDVTRNKETSSSWYDKFSY